MTKARKVIMISIVCIALVLGYALTLNAWIITFYGVSPGGLNILYLGSWVLATLAAAILGQRGFGRGLGESVEREVITALGYSAFFTVMALVFFTVFYQSFVGLTCCGIVSGISVSAEIYTITMSAVGAYLAMLGKHLEEAQVL